VLCGDGGLQMSVQALSTLARQNIPAIVLVLDNGLYAIEQWTVEATRGIAASDKRSFFGNADVKAIPYLDLPRWDYAGLAKAMGFAHADQVDAAPDLLPALDRARAANTPCLIAVRVKQRSLPAELRGS
jgi:indolepyruvate decarboxylase